ncbi:MAG: hypothetical protein ACREQ7_12810 [Candidatus Binatia bacterium]
MNSPLALIARDLESIRVHPSTLEGVITAETRLTAVPELAEAEKQYNEVFESLRKAIPEGPVPGFEMLKTLLRLDEAHNYVTGCAGELYFKLGFVRALRAIGYSAEKIAAIASSCGIGEGNGSRL